MLGVLEVDCGKPATLGKEGWHTPNGSSSQSVLGARAALAQPLNALARIRQPSIRPPVPQFVHLYIFNLGSLPFTIQNESHVYAQMISPGAEMLVQNNANFYGTFIGDTLQVKNEGGFHLDTSGGSGGEMCGVELNDTPGSSVLPSPGEITSDVTFAQWYREILGVSMAAAHSITLVRDRTGVYEYLDDNFYPIDGILYGNEGDSRNNYFTYQITVDFTYYACADDAWMFVDDALAMDLGGLVPGTEQVVELDRLNLVDGRTYEMSFFFAHRYHDVPGFNLRTNVEFSSDEVVVVASFPCD